MRKLGKFEAVVGASISRLGGDVSAGEIFDDIVTSGGRAYLANVYVTLERLEKNGIVISRSVRRETPDGKERDVHLYKLTGNGRIALTSAIREMSRAAASLRTPRLLGAETK